jgi:hypothetical protein
MQRRYPVIIADLCLQHSLIAVLAQIIIVEQVVIIQELHHVRQAIHLVALLPIELIHAEVIQSVVNVQEVHLIVAELPHAVWLMDVIHQRMESVTVSELVQLTAKHHLTTVHPATVQPNVLLEYVREWAGLARRFINQSQTSAVISQAIQQAVARQYPQPTAPSTITNRR